MKIVSFSMQIILNLKSAGDISKIVQIGSTLLCNLLFVLFFIRYLLEHFVYLKMSQISVPMITFIGPIITAYRSYTDLIEMLFNIM